MNLSTKFIVSHHNLKSESTFENVNTINLSKSLEFAINESSLKIRNSAVNLVKQFEKLTKLIDTFPYPFCFIFTKYF